MIRLCCFNVYSFCSLMNLCCCKWQNVMLKYEMSSSLVIRGCNWHKHRQRIFALFQDINLSGAYGRFRENPMAHSAISFQMWDTEQIRCLPHRVFNITETQMTYESCALTVYLLLFRLHTRNCSVAHGRLLKKRDCEICYHPGGRDIVSIFAVLEVLKVSFQLIVSNIM